MPKIEDPHTQIAPTAKTSEILEVSATDVKIKITGEYPEAASGLKVSINNSEHQFVSKKNLAAASGDISATITNDTFTLLYSIPDPSTEKIYKFSIVASYGDGVVSRENIMEVTYKPTSVPTPIIITNSGNNFFTNDITTTLDGTCVTGRVEYVELRHREYPSGTFSAWTNIGLCSAGTFTWTASTWTGNPNTEYEVEVRGAFTGLVEPYSNARTIRVSVDTIVPNAVSIVGIKSDANDQNIDAWLGLGNPLLDFTIPDAEDNLSFQAEIRNGADTADICVLKNFNLDPIQFLTADCGAFVNAQSYIAKVYRNDLAGNQSVAATLNFQVDRQSPVINITDAPVDGTPRNYADFTFNVSDALSGISTSARCSLNGAASVPCTSPYSVTNLTTGQAHSMAISVTDNAGNIATTTHNWNISVDSSVPTCIISSTHNTWDNDTTETVTFSCTDDDAIMEYQCRLTTGAWGACTTSTTYVLTGLSEALHTVEVRARDYSNNYSTVQTVSFNVDVSTPLVAFTSQPTAATADNTPTFVFGATDVGVHPSGIASLECQLDGGGWNSCTSPYTTGALTDGPHTFEIRSTDVAGNPSLIVTSSFDVDTSVPGAPTFPTMPMATADLTPLWEWVSGGGGGTGTYRYKVNDSDLTSGAITTTNDFYQTLVDLALGPNIIYVQEQNAALTWSPTGSHTLTIMCPAGSYDAGGICSLCPAGTYTSAINLDASCTTTDPGSYATGPGATGQTPCQAGYYCPAGSTGPTGAGICDANTYSTGGATSSTCTSCPANSITVGALATNRDALDDCLGITDYHSCQDGTCDPSAIGFYSPNGSNANTACTNKPSNSTYTSSGGGADNCGWSCDLNYTQVGSNCYAKCPGGQYRANASDTFCTNVGTNHYSPANDDDRYACTNNRLTSGTTDGEADDSGDCKAIGGYWGLIVGIDATDVGQGYYSPNRDNNRYQCAAGRYGSTFNNIDADCDGYCSAGYFCIAGSTSATQELCDAIGYYCPTASETETQYSCSAAWPTFANGAWTNAGGTAAASCDFTCNATRYKDTTNKTCLSCTNGKYSAAANSLTTANCAGDCTNSPTNADAWSFTGPGSAINNCPVGVTSCDPAYYISGGNSCVACSNGRYTSTGNETNANCTGACTNTVANATTINYSGPGTAINNCPIGSVTCDATYYRNTATSCSTCASGYYSASGNTHAANTCAGACNNTPSNADMWSFTGPGSAINNCPLVVSSCNAAYYINGGNSCASCAAGRYTSTGNETNANCTGACTNTPTNADAWSFTGAGTAINNCPVGVTSCDPAYYINGGNSCAACTAGRYTSTGNETNANCTGACTNTPTNADVWSFTGAGTAINNCPLSVTSCNAAYYISGGNSCAACTAGRYTSTGNETNANCTGACTNTPANADAWTFSGAGTAINNCPVSVTSCNPAHYISGGNSCASCANGRYSGTGNETNANCAGACTNTPANADDFNYTSAGTTSTDCSFDVTSCLGGYYESANSCLTCVAGNFCSGGYPSVQSTCVAGSRCPAGSTSGLACGTGEYQDQTGQSTCKSCTNTAPNAASFTYGFSSGLTVNNCPISSVTCNAANYRVTADACSSCANGYYSASGNTHPTNTCAGSCNNTPTNADAWSFTGPGTAINNCPVSVTSCNPAYYISGGNSCVMCSDGRYTSTGNETAATCTGACTNTVANATSVTYSGPGTAINTCPIGSVTCNASYFRNTATSCSTCANGYYSASGNTHATNTCAGSCTNSPTNSDSWAYTSSGTTSTNCSYDVYSCSPGYYESGISCLSCSAGNYCDGGTPSNQTTCPANSYCPAGSSAPIACGSTRTSPAGSTSSAACTCPAGTYDNGSICVTKPNWADIVTVENSGIGKCMSGSNTQGTLIGPHNIYIACTGDFVPVAPLNININGNNTSNVCNTTVAIPAGGMPTSYLMSIGNYYSGGTVTIRLGNSGGEVIDTFTVTCVP